jgi:hypothetical protein
VHSCFSTQSREVESCLRVDRLLKTTTNVYRANVSGQAAAVKVLNASTLEVKACEEVRILQKVCRSPFIVEFLGAGFSRRFGWYVCMGLISRSLEQILFHPPRRRRVSQNASPVETFGKIRLMSRLRMAADIAEGALFSVVLCAFDPLCVLYSTSCGSWTQYSLRVYQVWSFCTRNGCFTET